LMARKAAALGVDPKEGLLKAGLRQLNAAQDALRQGVPSKAASFIGQAEGALREAIRSSPRITVAGSTPEEIENALRLCRKETGNNPDCVAASFADERARKVSLSAFGLDELPATNAEFAAFAAKTGYATAAEKQHGLYAAAEKATLLPNWSWR